MNNFVNLVGKKFERLLVVSLNRIENKRDNGGKSVKDVFWNCKCDCGADKVVLGSYLKNGHVKSCGCLMSRQKHKDLTGKVFGRWTVVGRGERPAGIKSKIAYWLCRCICGNEKSVNRTSLINGQSQSCGCLQKELMSERRSIDLTGIRFGRLLVLEEVERPEYRNDNRSYWNCLCDCGNNILVSSSDLGGGHTRSCGCLAIDKRTKPIGESSFNRIYGEYKRGAKNRNFPFELTKDIFKSIIEQNCFYCGKEPSEYSCGKKENGKFIHNGIDRIDSTQGYIIENCVPCCEQCNKAKLATPKEEFLEWIERVYNYSIKNKEII